MSDPARPLVAEISAEEFAAKAEAARRAATTWRRAGVSERVEILRKVWRELLARREEIAAVVCEETGKPAAEVELMELASCGLLVDHFCAEAPRLLGRKAAKTPWFFLNKRAYVRRVPRGVVGLICPWNLPFLIPFGDAFAAMLAGNAVLLKPSEWTTKTALWLESALASTGLLPEGLLTVVSGGGACGERVVDACDLVVFTGSIATGKAVAARAAAQLKPSILELGGKHPMIVLEDAPIERTSAAAVWAACANAGQVCVGVERVFIEAGAHDAFVERVRARLAALRVGRGQDFDVGRFVVAALLDRAQAQLEDARQKGAQVTGGAVLDREGLLMAPALVTGARMDMAVMSEETFGPILPVMKVARAEEAVSLVNAGPYGLAASVWGGDLERAEALGELLEAGLVGINEPATHYALGGLPFGGMKSSGMWRRHGEEGFLAFTQPQSVLVHEWPAQMQDPWWFPYEKEKTSLLRRLMGLP